LAIVGGALKIPRRKVRAAIEKAGRRHYEYLEPIIDVYNDMEAQRHALIVGDVNYGLALTDFFAQDLGWIPELTVIANDLTEENQKKIFSGHKNLGGVIPEKLAFESGAKEIEKLAREIWGKKPESYADSRLPAFVAGGSFERSLATDLGAAHLSLSYPIANRAILTRGYAGYDGGLCLAEDAVSAFIAFR
jgi:nitrogenase molybdenum-iron protein beta chain